jgi:hypothetical protein
MSWDDAKAFNEATTAVKALIVRLAEVAGAEIREHPVWPGAASTVREAEPMTGIRAALAAQLAAAAAARHYIAAARADGMTWAQVGEVLMLGEAIDRADSPSGMAAAAFEYAAGSADLFGERSFGWTCPACQKRIRDHGPYDSNPLDNQSGHAAGCARLAAEVAEWEAAWGDE